MQVLGNVVEQKYYSMHYSFTVLCKMEQRCDDTDWFWVAIEVIDCFHVFCFC